jgi:hypothetical protein
MTEALMLSLSSRTAARLPVAVPLIAGYAAVFALFEAYDWGHPIVKVSCFAALAAIVAVATLVRPRGEGGSWGLAELAACGAIAGWSLCHCRDFFPLGPAGVDVGATTEAASVALFRSHVNPYLVEMSRFGQDHRFWAFKYGPGMVLGYGLAAIWPDGVGLKISNLLYYGATVAMVCVLAAPRGSRLPRLPSPTTCAFVVALAFVPGRVRFELLQQGVIDAFPTLLLVGSLLAVRRQTWFFAGLLVGLSVSAKISPGVFFLLLFVRRDISRRFILGALCGLAPLLAFIAWDARALYDNAFLFHATKSFDSTSLMSVVPRGLHFLFPVLQLLACLGTIAWGQLRRLDVRSIVRRYLVLMTLVEVTYREMHINHLFWFIPFIILELAWLRAPDADTKGAVTRQARPGHAGAQLSPAGGVP